MKFAIFVGLAILALATAGVQGKATQNGYGADDDSSELGQSLLLFINAYQKIMPCGFEAMNIPVLAPYSIPFYEFNVQNDNVNVTGHFSNMIIAGMNKFRILASNYNATTGRFFYDIIYPEMQILGEQRIRGFIEFAGFPIHFDVDGLVNLKIEDFRFIGEFTIKENPKQPNTLEMRIHEMNYLVGDISANSWNKKWDIVFNNFMNRWVAQSLMLFNEEIQPFVKHLYAKYVLPLANWGLSQIDMNQLVSEYLTLAAEFDAADCQKTGNLA